MFLCVFEIKRLQFKKAAAGVGFGISFIILSVAFRNAENEFISFFLGLLACAAVVLFYIDRKRQGKIMAFFSKYTMPIFLMHSMFAATLRSVLLKAGVTNAVIQITCGIAVSVFGPIIAAWVMKKTKYLEFFIYPCKFIKFNVKNK